MRPFSVLVIAALALLWPSPGDTLGHPLPCAPRAQVLAHLAQKYKEVPVAVGVSGRALVEVLSAPGGLTWTLVLTFTDAQTCVVLSGENWRSGIPALSGEPL